MREASGRGGAKHAMRLFVANFPVRKAADFELVAKCEHLPLDPSDGSWCSTSPRALWVDVLEVDGFGAFAHGDAQRGEAEVLGAPQPALGRADDEVEGVVSGAS